MRHLSQLPFTQSIANVHPALGGRPRTKRNARIIRRGRPDSDRIATDSRPHHQGQHQMRSVDSKLNLPRTKIGKDIMHSSRSNAAAFDQGATIDSIRFHCRPAFIPPLKRSQVSVRLPRPSNPCPSGCTSPSLSVPMIHVSMQLSL
jgi:hypothetical protein